MSTANRSRNSSVTSSISICSMPTSINIDSWDDDSIEGGPASISGIITDGIHRSSTTHEYVMSSDGNIQIVEKSVEIVNSKKVTIEPSITTTVVCVTCGSTNKHQLMWFCELCEVSPMLKKSQCGDCTLQNHRKHDGIVSSLEIRQRCDSASKAIRENAKTAIDSTAKLTDVFDQLEDAIKQLRATVDIKQSNFDDYAEKLSAEMNNAYLTGYGIDVVRDNFYKNYLDYTEKAIINISSGVKFTTEMIRRRIITLNQLQTHAQSIDEQCALFQQKRDKMIRLEASLDEIENVILSPIVIIDDKKWRLRISTEKSIRTSLVKYLCSYIVSADEKWSNNNKDQLAMKLHFRLLSQRENVDNRCMPIVHTVLGVGKSYGYIKFIEWSDLIATDSVYVNKDGKITVEVDIKLE